MHPIRTAREEDLPGITAIYNQAIATRQATADLSPVSVEQRRQWLARHAPDRHPVFVATEDGEVTGYSSLSQYREGREALRGTAEISYYVHSGHQNRGIGSALIEHTMAAAVGLGFHSLFGILLDINSDSVRILEKYGFERWGHLPGVADLDGRICGHLYYGRQIGGPQVPDSG